MAINRENSGYTIIYASVMVIIVALGLAFTHMGLKKQQVRNENIDKMQQILRSLNIDANNKVAEQRYNELIKNAYLITADGQKVEGTDGVTPNDPAFSGLEADKGIPVFEAEIDGTKKYILSMDGTGLWGPIWGYLSVESDGSTIYGAEFGHAGETPGLGAEIATVKFRNQFNGKELIKNNEFKSVAVVKPGQSDADRDYVDGISGGTITSKGVNNMLFDSVKGYENFLKNLHSENQPTIEN